MTDIAASLTTEKPVALLHGMGGVGKTQTAAKFAQDHAKDYNVAWWVAAETVTEADAGYAALAQARKLPSYDPCDAAKARTAVINWMQRDSNWLVVLDNAESPAALKPWLPTAAGVGSGQRALEIREAAYVPIIPLLPLA